jgi:hypothetical protein
MTRHRALLSLSLLSSILALVTLALVTLVGCGGQTYTASELWPVTIGSSWTMVNKFGDETFYTIEAAPVVAACENGHNFVMHVTKNASITYWGDGIPGAEDREFYHIDDDGSIRGIVDNWQMPQGCPWCQNGQTAGAEEWRPIPGLPLPYVNVPAVIASGETLTMPTQYALYAGKQNTTACLAQTDPATYVRNVAWESIFSIVQVDTPVYSGPALATDQWEDHTATSQGVHETWYFAPGIGLVQVDSYLQGGIPQTMQFLQQLYGSDVITIKRVP